MNGLALLQRFIRWTENLSEWTGRASAWLIPAIVLLTVYDVSMRKFFGTGSVVIQELEWHLFALAFLLGAAYTLKYDDHVRIDIVYQGRWMNPRRRDWVNLLGGLFLLTPFCLLIMISAWPFVVNAYVQNETSPDGGLPARWLLKVAIPLGFLLLMLQGWATSLRCLLRLLGHAPQSEAR